MSLTYLAPALTLVLEVARRNGVDPKPLLQKQAIDPGRLTDAEYRLRLEQVLKLMEALEETLPPQATLDFHDSWNPNAMGVLGLGWLTSPTLGAAFERLIRYSRIVTEGVRIRQVDTRIGKEEAVALEFEFREPEKAPVLRMGSTMATLLAMCQALAGRDFHPLEVALAHAAPADTGPWFEHFRCPVVFDAPVCRFVVSMEAVAAARTPVSAHLEQLHDRMMLDYLQNMEGGGLEEKVKAAIIELLPSGEVTDAKVAEQLFMTDRTLQRRLHQSGTTFKQLLTEVRNELAEHYLREGRYSLSEISYLLGFSELSAFSRAFKRWKGVPPSAWRAA